jgi:hypothetical protein
MPPTLHDGICTNNSYIHTYGGAITAPLLAAIHNWDLPLESDSRTVVQLGDGFNHRCLKRRPLGAESLAREPAPLNPTTPEAPATRQPRKRRQPGSPEAPAIRHPPEAPANPAPRKRRHPGSPGSAGNPATPEAPAIRQSGTLATRHSGTPALRHSGTPALAVCLAEVGAAPGRAVSRLFPGPPFRRPPVSLCGGRGARRAGTQSPLFFFFFLSFFRLVH